MISTCINYVLTSRCKMQFVDNSPKYMVIADIFRSQIEQGILRQGDKLLAGSAIAKQYNVDHRTVSAGLNVLVKEDLLERVPGRGTIIKAQIKTPVYLLIPCPGFLDENINSAVFIRRLCKNLHLQLMKDGIPVITVPMSPSNNPNDISEKYFDIIPAGAKVICIGEWGLEGVECLKKRKCNVVFYDFQHGKRSELVDKKWGKIIFDRAHGAYNAVAELAKNGFTKPLFMLAESKRSKNFTLKTLKALKAQAEYYPNLPQENILWYNEAELETFLDQLNELLYGVDFDSIFFASAGFDNVIQNTIKNGARCGIISNDTTEIISAPDLCHYATDFEQLAKMTIDLFSQPDDTIQTIKPKLYNKIALMNKKEMV